MKQTVTRSTLFVGLLFLHGCNAPSAVFVQICHEYNIVCVNTRKYFIGLVVTKGNNKDPTSSVETIFCSGRIELELPRCTREPVPNGGTINRHMGKGTQR